jgi:hypothetical protein
MNFTFNNHLKYSIGGRKFGVREEVYDKYTVSVDEVDHSHYRKTNWLLEQYRIADLVYRDLGKDLVVMFSGGTDSEIVLRAFKKIGIKPRAVFIRFENDYNLRDYEIALKVAADIGIPVEVMDFDVIDFYNSGQALELASQVQCSQLAYLNVYHHIAKLQVPAVMGGEVLLKRHVSPSACKWYYCFRETEDASAMRFSEKYNLPLVNEWFSYTPEVLGHYLTLPAINKLVSERFNYKLTSVSTKNSILQALMPSILRKVKTTGFEKLMGFNAIAYRTLQESYVKALEPSLNGIFMEDIYRQLFGEKYASN